MSNPDPEDLSGTRNRRSLYLLMAGIASLLIPLLAVLYLRMSETGSRAAAVDSPGAFVRREGSTGRIKSASAAAMPLPPLPAANPSLPKAAAYSPAAKNDSLGFIKGGSEYFPKEKPEAPPPPQITTQEQPAPEQKSAPSKQKGKTAYKPFNPPKLQSTGSSFSNFRGRQSWGTNSSQQSREVPTDTEQPGQGAASAGGYRKTVSGPGSGTDLPSLSKKKAPADQAPDGPPPGEMPDVDSMLNSIPGATDPSKTGGVDIGGMLNNIPGVGADKKK